MINNKMIKYKVLMVVVLFGQAQIFAAERGCLSGEDDPFGYMNCSPDRTRPNSPMFSGNSLSGGNNSNATRAYPQQSRDLSVPKLLPLSQNQVVEPMERRFETADGVIEAICVDLQSLFSAPTGEKTEKKRASDIVTFFVREYPRGIGSIFSLYEDTLKLRFPRNEGIFQEIRESFKGMCRDYLDINKYPFYYSDLRAMYKRNNYHFGMDNMQWYFASKINNSSEEDKLSTIVSVAESIMKEPFFADKESVLTQVFKKCGLSSENINSRLSGLGKSHPMKFSIQKVCSSMSRATLEKKIAEDQEKQRQRDFQRAEEEKKKQRVEEEKKKQRDGEIFEKITGMLGIKDPLERIKFLYTSGLSLGDLKDVLGGELNDFFTEEQKVELKKMCVESVPSDSSNAKSEEVAFPDVSVKDCYLHIDELVAFISAKLRYEQASGRSITVMPLDILFPDMDMRVIGMGLRSLAAETENKTFMDQLKALEEKVKLSAQQVPGTFVDVKKYPFYYPLLKMEGGALSEDEMIRHSASLIVAESKIPAKLGSLLPYLHRYARMIVAGNIENQEKQKDLLLEYLDIAGYKLPNQDYVELMFEQNYQPWRLLEDEKEQAIKIDKRAYALMSEVANTIEKREKDAAKRAHKK